MSSNSNNSVDVFKLYLIPKIRVRSKLTMLKTASSIIVLTEKCFNWNYPEKLHVTYVAKYPKMLYMESTSAVRSFFLNTRNGLESNEKSEILSDFKSQNGCVR